jgi:hypothetical protein
MASTVNWVIYNSTSKSVSPTSGFSNTSAPYALPTNISTINFNTFSGTSAGVTMAPMVSGNNSYSFWVGLTHDGYNSFNNLLSGSYLINLPTLPSGVTINGLLSKVYSQKYLGYTYIVQGGDYTPPQQSSTLDPALNNLQVLQHYGVWKSGNNNLVGNISGGPFDTGSSIAKMGASPYPVTYNQGYSQDVVPFYTHPMRLQLQSTTIIPKSVINISNFLIYYWSEN